MDINAALYFNPRTKCYDVVPLREAHEKRSTVVVERLDTDIHELRYITATEPYEDGPNIEWVEPRSNISKYGVVVGVRLKDPEAAMAEYHMIKDDYCVYNELDNDKPKYKEPYISEKEKTDIIMNSAVVNAGPTEKVEASVSFVNEGPDQCCTEYPKCEHEFRKNKREERLKIINALTSSFDDGELTNKISDGSHTFEGLYHHRAVLTSLFANTVALKLDDLIDSMISRNHKENDENSALYITRAEATQGVRDRWDVWRSFLHEDGTMFDDYFIIGFTTQEGTFSYHYHKDYWDMFDGVREVAKAPAYDGHTEDDIMRLTLLLDLFK